MTLSCSLIALTFQIMNDADRHTIFVVNDSGHRYDLAKKLPGLHNARYTYLTRGSISPTKVDRIAFSLIQGIAESKESDFLLLSGSPIINALAGMIWTLQHPTCNLLIFDAKKQGYVRRILSVDNLATMLEKRLFV